MINSIRIPKAYSEVYSFINALGNSYISRIPDSIYNTIKANRDMNYNPEFKNNERITNGMISQEALSLIAALNLQYWCENSLEKSNLKETYINNTKIEEEKYSYDNLFKNKESGENIKEDVISNSTALVEYKESFFTRIINKIKNIFKKRKS